MSAGFKFLFGKIFRIFPDAQQAVDLLSGGNIYGLRRFIAQLDGGGCKQRFCKHHFLLVAAG
jgi:hypothetical protein